MIKASKIVVLALIANFILFCPPAWSQSNWGSWTEVVEPKDVSLTINISGDPYYGYDKAWIQRGLLVESNADMSATQVSFNKEGFRGRVILADGLGRIWFSERTASQSTKDFAYWKNKEIEVKNNGSFTMYGSTLRWIAFNHTRSGEAENSCAGFTASGRGARLAVRGYWCTVGGRPMTEADVRGFANSIGYKDLLSPQPLAKPPGR
jgi:hypothetical protein